MSYMPYIEYEVTLRVHVPRHEAQVATPLEWDWADLTDMDSEDITFHSQRIVDEYNRDVED